MTTEELKQLNDLLVKLINSDGYLTQMEYAAACTTQEAVESVMHYPSREDQNATQSR